jgi:hypothetical protein
VDVNPHWSEHRFNSWEGALLRSQAGKSNAPLETFMGYVFDGLRTKESKGKAPDNPLIA